MLFCLPSLVILSSSMATNPNSFCPIPPGFDHSYYDVKDHHMLPLHSSSDQNLVNESNLINSHSLVPNPNIDCCIQRNHAMISHGQLGISQRMPEVRRTHIAPHRIQVHSFIDYFPQQQNQSLIPQNEVIVTDFMRTTKVFSSNPTKEPLFTSNNTYHLYGQDNFQNHILPTLNPSFSSNFHPIPESNKNQAHASNMEQTNHSMRFKSPIQQSSLMDVSFSYVEPNKSNENDMDGDLASCGSSSHVDTSPLMRVKPLIQQLPSMHASKENYGTTGGLTKMSTLVQEYTNRRMKFEQVIQPLPNVQKSTKNTCPSEMIGDGRTHSLPHQKYGLQNTCPSEIMGDGRTRSPPQQKYGLQYTCPSEIIGDGRTHSLPHQKYGPYTCPKCKEVLLTSQSFAAHVSTHYKYESIDQRHKRLAAKYKRKSLTLFQRCNGVTMMPPSSKIKRHPQRQVDMVDNNTTNQAPEGQETSEATTIKWHFDSNIKEEPMVI